MNPKIEQLTDAIQFWSDFQKIGTPVIGAIVVAFCVGLAQYKINKYTKLKAQLTMDKKDTPDNRKGNFSEGQAGGTVNQTYIENKEPLPWALKPSEFDELFALCAPHKDGVINVYVTTSSTESNKIASQMLQALREREFNVQGIGRFMIDVPVQGWKVLTGSDRIFPMDSTSIQVVVGEKPKQ